MWLTANLLVKWTIKNSLAVILPNKTDTDHSLIKSNGVGNFVISFDYLLNQLSSIETYFVINIIWGSECFCQIFVTANNTESPLVIIHVVPSVTKFCKQLLIQYLCINWRKMSPIHVIRYHLSRFSLALKKITNVRIATFNDTHFLQKWIKQVLAWSCKQLFHDRIQNNKQKLLIIDNRWLAIIFRGSCHITQRKIIMDI